VIASPVVQQAYLGMAAEEETATEGRMAAQGRTASEGVAATEGETGRAR
jgi:hypothetical protein